MRLVFTEQAWDDCRYWQKNDKKILRRVNELIKETLRTPFSGLGKPEPPRHQLHGLWSRRVTQEHRLGYI
jgi:toxin YoeB